jgi:antitoxin MazE
MRVQVKKWGNSASVRIPSAILKAVDFELDMHVDVSHENNCIILSRVHEPEYSIDALIEAIEPNNLHGEQDFGTLGIELL